MARTGLAALHTRMFRPSPRFTQFLATRWAVVLAVLVAVVGTVGAGVAVWRVHRRDAQVQP